MIKDVRKTTLDNGVRILTKHIPHVHSVAMGVWVNVGARDETEKEAGLSHLIEHMIFKGTQRRSGYQIAKEFDAIGGQTNAFTTMENTCYHASVMDTHLATMVDILSDIFLNSVFEPQELERERPVILQEIGMVEDSPEEHVHLLAANTVWDKHPLGRSILGRRRNIQSFEAADIKRFFDTHYQPDQIVISAAGNVDPDRFADMVGPAFETIPCNPLPSRRQKPTTHQRTALYPRDIEQTHICFGAGGLPITDPARYASSLMNTIFGGNMSSRLFQQIREQRGLAYSVYSYITSYVDSGLFGAYAGVDADNALEATEIMLSGHKQLAEERVTANELADAKEYTKGSLMLASESTENQMARIAQNEIHFGCYVPLQKVVDRVDAVSVDDVIELAQRLRSKGFSALTLMGPLTDQKPFDDLLRKYK